MSTICDNDRCPTCDAIGLGCECGPGERPLTGRRDEDSLSAGAAEAAERKLSGTPCPACGAHDWLADHRQANGQIACYCDDCGYAVRVSL